MPSWRSVKAPRTGERSRTTAWFREVHFKFKLGGGYPSVDFDVPVRKLAKDAMRVARYTDLLEKVALLND
jgi:hypothetical protein